MNLLIADDHTLFRDALSYYIKRENPGVNISSVGDVYEAEAFLNEQDESNPIDIILLDLLMPGMNGMLGISKIVNSYPEIPVLLMSGVATHEDIKKAIELGCVGFFPKTLSCQVLMNALDLIEKGEKYIPIDPDTGKIKTSHNSDEPECFESDESTNKFLDQNIHDRWLSFREDAVQNRGVMRSEDDVSKDFISLTKREEDVLQQLVKGKKNKEIADALGVKTVTVKLHVRSIFRKLDVSNRTQAALRAKKYNIVG